MSYVEKKTDRKIKRFAARLKSCKGIITTDIPGPNIVLCNFGQATNLVSDDIHALLKKSNPELPLPKLIAEKGESYSFLVFNKAEDALLFYKEHNGKAKFCEKGPTIYMNFVENVPNLEIVCNYATPKGLHILNDFITPEEESMFLKLFNFEDTSNLKNRQVQHYGYEFQYGSNDVNQACPLEEGIPKECDVLWHRLRKQGLDVGVPDQLTVNKYKPGHGIPSHVDKHSPFGPTILSLSLGSSVVMEWRHHGGALVPVVVPNRSMLVMKDEARYDWQHGIQPRTWDPIIKQTSPEHYVITAESRPRGERLSLTFRWTRGGPCDCAFKTLCDSAAAEIDDAMARRLEELHVHQVYEQIAGHFSATRHTAWPRVAQFVRAAPPGALALDLGCGNGKNMLARRDIFQVGGEYSSGLLAECRARARGHTDCVRLDACAAPLRDACLDLVLCVAVVHHFSTRGRRLQAIGTIARLLRRGGRALVTVWARDQARSGYLAPRPPAPAAPRALRLGPLGLPVHQNRTPFQHQDLLVPWKHRNLEQKNPTENTLLRYYHVFERGELENLCDQISDLVIEESFYEEGNWCVIVKKK